MSKSEMRRLGTKHRDQVNRKALRAKRAVQRTAKQAARDFVALMHYARSFVRG